MKVLKIFSQFRVPRWCSEVEELVEVLMALTQDKVPLRPLVVCHLNPHGSARARYGHSGAGQVRTWFCMVPVLGAKGCLLVDE